MKSNYSNSIFNAIFSLKKAGKAENAREWKRKHEVREIKNKLKMGREEEGKGRQGMSTKLNFHFSAYFRM